MLKNKGRLAHFFTRHIGSMIIIHLCRELCNDTKPTMHQPIVRGLKTLYVLEAHHVALSLSVFSLKHAVRKKINDNFVDDDCV